MSARRIETGSTKLTIIASKYPFSGRVPLVPPILEYLAALTLRELPDAHITLVDANQQEIAAENIRTDIVAISAMTATITWAYRFADACRKRGIHVILGGIHPTALPEEAALHADTVVIGEAESVWGAVLRDIRSGRSKKFYHGERVSLMNLPKPIDGNLKGNYQFRAFFTMRGCPYRCTFCSVRRFFGDTIRYRPIPEVVDEIESCAGNIWFNGDDNIWGGDLKRSTELFSELAKGEKKRSWYGFGDLRSVQNAQGVRMLAAARASGLFSVWAGWESDDLHLKAFNASGKQGADRTTAVKMMQDAGIDVTLFVVLGGRQDSLDSYKRTLELSEKMNVGIHPVLLTPLPGTELYEEYKNFLLPGLGWDSFVGVKAVFDHPAPEMSPVRRELEYHHLNQELFRFRSIVRRIASLPRSVFPKTHLLSFMTQMPMKLAFSKAYDEWKSNLQNDGQKTAIKDREPASSVSCGGSYALTRWSEMMRRSRFSPDRKLHAASLKIYGSGLAAITFIHILHGLEPGVSATLDRADAVLQHAETFIFWGVVPFAGLTIFAREINVKKKIVAIGRIASDKIDHWSIALKELAYSSLIGAGTYWAYACMVELL